MQDKLATQIRATAARVRLRDFLWAAAISAGATLVVAVSGLAPWWLPVLFWLVFLAALGVRYRLSAGREWAQPLERVVETELVSRDSELATLRLARGVAHALPDPLFILNTDGVIELANPAAEELLSHKDVEGRHFASALRAPAVFEAVERIVQNGEESCSVDFSTMGAVERYCRAFIAPLELEQGARRVLVFVRDLTSERRLEQMRADFIASASHELRTPLASLLGFIETLRGPAAGDAAAQEKFLTIMQAQAERMQRLVADLMSLSRIELNEHVPPREIVDLGDTAQDVIEGLAPLFEQSSAIVDFALDENVKTGIQGERDEIVQAIQNLLANAVKYGGDPALVKINVGRGAAPPLSTDGEPAHRAGDSAAQVAARLGVDVEDLVYVQVRDFGPGVERADLPRLTERFYRVNVERSRKSGGTGLGLAIVKHITNRHKGGLQIESRLAGGTAFTCYFRALPAAAAPSQG
ncbi:MAG: ATP-binding protein [Parvularculaceae bacterium]